MSLPVFKLQLVDAAFPYPILQLPAGGTLERDFVQLIASKILANGVRDALIQDVADTVIPAILKRGVGFWKSEEHVIRAIREGIEEAFDNIPEHPGAIQKFVRQGITDAIADLKRESVGAA